MKLKGIAAVFFSPTGNTRKAVVEIADVIARREGIAVREIDFTLPGAREEVRKFEAGELVIFGTPVYAGRIPNKILPAVQTLFEGNGALAVPVVTFGNRSFDNALIELRIELEQHGFHTIAGAAFVAEHVFSNKLADGRPDEKDLELIRRFAGDVAEKIKGLEEGPLDGMAEIPAPAAVKGIEPVPAYYRPLQEDGSPANFLKAKPKTSDSCNDCGICARVCPMGSISPEDYRTVTGICIKCQACVKSCPVHAKFFDDPVMLSHTRMLEQHYERPAENEVFL
ncbi:MAG: EFR1 family ferrodoxin [Succiniclasticum sp.]|nr:EFR1 family ferrodoxin [Succiniclasticum sp.]